MVNQGKVDGSEFSPLAYLVENVAARGRSDAAANYLKELVPNSGVRAALSKMLPEMAKNQKIALCPVFAASNAPDATATLNTLAKDIDPDVAFAASKALRTLQTRRAS